MIQDIGEKAFDNHFEAKEPSADDYVLHFRGRSALVRMGRPAGGAVGEGVPGERIALPRLADYPSVPGRTVFLFSEGGRDFFLALDEDPAVPGGFSHQELGRLRGAGPRDLRFAAVTGAQLSAWYRENRFCSRCGHRTELAPASREIVCPDCAGIVYPKIQPGVICAVVWGDRLLLTHRVGRPGAPWALVAGYAEIGEDLEGTVRREVMEEVGLRVRGLRYHGSQPWGFSDTLLVGFWCEVDGDPTVRVDGQELAEARWFSPSEIGGERVADQASLTGEMIELFRAKGRAAFG